MLAALGEEVDDSKQSLVAAVAGNLRLRVSSLSTSSVESLFGNVRLQDTDAVAPELATVVVTVDACVPRLLILSGSIVASYCSNLFAISVMETDFARDLLLHTRPLSELCLLCCVWAVLLGFSLDARSVRFRCCCCCC